MYLRHTIRRKDGKVHCYWRLVRGVRVGRRVIQQTVAHLRHCLMTAVETVCLCVPEGQFVSSGRNGEPGVAAPEFAESAVQ